MTEETLHLGWHQPHSLPHFDSPEITQFVTFRLADSLPANAVNPDRTNEFNRRRVERELDRGSGACWLKIPEIADLVERSLLAFDGERYRLWAWCVMPNHVHSLFEMIEGNRLGDIVKSWKGYTAIRANRILRLDGPFWQRDYFDRYMRNEEQMARTIDYIERNPVQAGLCREPAEWRWSSAHFR
ncbi:REP-associated tyrosine transposase [Labrys miyagiensis]|uniref:REP-associated tyrosine transposase n=1 Tax=Labrys miyagiensis TaxID=346912 RepID=UPI0024E0CB13|nr:transposase [Labrys miyagiensis]